LKFFDLFDFLALGALFFLVVKKVTICPIPAQLFMLIGSPAKGGIWPGKEAIGF